VRGFGFLFGLLLLAEGLPKIFNPAFWSHYTERNWRGRLPEEATKTITDFSRLSENSARALALVEITAGLTMLFMSSMLRWRPMMAGGMWQHGAPWMGFGGKGGPWMAMQGKMGGHMHPHTHEHTHPHTHEEGGPGRGPESV
jgi:uncharacterized protein YjeT (DUF2065 family)